VLAARDSASKAQFFLHSCLCRVAKAHGIRHRSGKLAYELLPPVVTNQGEGIRRLIAGHQLKAVLYLGDDICDTDAFRTLRTVQAGGNCMTLLAGVLHPDTAVSLIKSADLVADGPAGAKTFSEHLVNTSPGSLSET
jgi:trehalose-phosphatase